MRVCVRICVCVDEMMICETITNRSSFHFHGSKYRAVPMAECHVMCVRSVCEREGGTLDELFDMFGISTSKNIYVLLTQFFSLAL